MKAIAFVSFVLLWSCFASAQAEPGGRTLLQLNHRAFTPMEGAPFGIAALAQTPDGTLWIGGRAGLMRFDGLRFVPYPGPADEPLKQTNVATLLATADGSLWISFRPNGVCVLKRGRVTHFGKSDGLPEGTVAQFAQDLDGSIWAAARTGLAHFDGNTWRTVARSQELGSPYGVMIDGAGTLWVATTKGLRARVAGESHFREIDDRSYFSPRGVVLSATNNGGIRAAARDEIIGVEPGDIRARPVATIPGMDGGPLLIDVNGNLWSADIARYELLRVEFADLGTSARRDSAVPSQRFKRADGLGSGPVQALLEDRERNIWAATNTSLHRFTQSNVVLHTARSCSHYGSLNAPPIAAGDGGSLWIACDNGFVSHLEEIRGGQVASRVTAPPFTVAYRDSRGTVWFGGLTGLAHIEDGRLVSEPLLSHIRGHPITALLRDATGAMWVSVTRMGTFRFNDRAWSENGGLSLLPREPAYVMTEDSDGALWFGYTENRVARIHGREVQIFDSQHGLEVGNVQAIVSNGATLWVGGELGVARFDAGRFISIRSLTGTPLKGVSGIIRSRDGDLWINGIAGISRIARTEIERLLRDPTHLVQFETFNHLDGVPGPAVQLRPLPSTIETTDGRIWFAMTAGIVSLDPAQLTRNTLPPPVTIWSLKSGTRHYPNLGSDLHLRIHASDVQIEYSAGSLTVPERVRFRYKLDGLDSDWHDVGARREATYTNLGPGRYTFHVIASNNDGVWNEKGASISFVIPPAFYQTHWFYGLCALAFAAVLWMLYHIRVRQVTARVRDRLELRLAERERIARDLHDTLLQGIQGLIMKVHTAVLQIPTQESAREYLEHALDQAQQVLIEGRDRVTSLRLGTGQERDLTDDIAGIGEDMAEGTETEFRASTHGVARALHPIVREEGFQIIREAMLNAFRHARATYVRVDIFYDRKALRINVIDDGCGVPLQVLTAGRREHHWGMVGMRERAARIKSILRIENREGGGTQVELRVPASMAYRLRGTREREVELDP